MKSNYQATGGGPSDSSWLSAGRGASSTFDVLRSVIVTLHTTAGLVTDTLLVMARGH
jgi:hypothetical protein